MLSVCQQVGLDLKSGGAGVSVSFRQLSGPKLVMKNVASKLTRWRELARPDSLAALVSGLWLMIFLAFYVEPQAQRNAALDALGLGGSLALSAVVAVGLGVFVMTLNDVLDARHDRAFAPTRPIPAGRITQRAALTWSLAGLLAALGASVALGPVSVVLALVTAGAMVFYNLAGRFVPAVGLVTLGLVIALMMVIPNPRLAFAWPILLTLTHVIAVGTVRYWLAGKRPRLTPINGWGICVGWAFWILVVLALIKVRGGGAMRHELGLIWIGPAVATGGFCLLTWLMLGPSAMAPRARRATAVRFTKLATAWLIVFNASWLLSAGLWWQTAVVLALLIVPTAQSAPTANR